MKGLPQSKFLIKTYILPFYSGYPHQKPICPELNGVVQFQAYICCCLEPVCMTLLPLWDIRSAKEGCLKKWSLKKPRTNRMRWRGKKLLFSVVTDTDKSTHFWHSEIKPFQILIRRNCTCWRSVLKFSIYYRFHMIYGTPGNTDGYDTDHRI